MNRYDDIIDYHYTSCAAFGRKPMSPENRAAQFAPFAALSGFDDAIESSRPQEVPAAELSSDELSRLDRRLAYALAHPLRLVAVRWLCTSPDGGGKALYCSTYGRIKMLDQISRSIVMSDSTVIPLDRVCAIRISSASSPREAD